MEISNKFGTSNRILNHRCAILYLKKFLIGNGMIIRVEETYYQPGYFPMPIQDQ